MLRRRRSGGGNPRFADLVGRIFRARDRALAVFFAREDFFREALRFVTLRLRRLSVAVFPRFAVFFVARFRVFFMSLLPEERQS
jgi:hypothetical protein